ncbi:cytochrome P460 family protein [Methanosarcina sp. Mfa9]|uniref:cytochrome P460 family protein n=1 Tax=Methanosarcina sp. Mfa9 TaxID=3439063 RepID=UPI003F8430A0
MPAETETPVETEQEPVSEAETETPAETPEAEAAPEPTGEEIRAYVTEENNYKNWELWPGTGELEPGKGPHGDQITIYVSDSALSAIDEKAGVMPEGSTVLKEGYDSDGELIVVVVMHKVEGFDPAYNDWFWLEYDAEGEIIAEGRVLGCQNCHARQANNDYLFTGDLG